MAHRLGVFVAVIIFGLGLLVARPWIPGEDGIGAIVFMFSMIAATAYVMVRGLGWVFGR